MNIIKKCKELLTEEKNFIRDNKNAVLASNRKLFTILMICGIVNCVLLIIISYAISSYAVMRHGYVLILLCMVFPLLLTHRYKERNMMALYYLIYGLMAIYAAYSSAFVTSDYIGIMILIFLFEMPVVLLDNTLKITMYEFFIIAIYLVVVIPNKRPDLVTDEIVNIIIFMIIGFVTGAFFRWVRLRSMDLARRLDIERTTDVLTGLFNRRMLFEYFGKCETKQMTRNPYALAMIDIDNFKQYNDTYGHVAGDRCLKQLGDCFSTFGKINNIDFYRYGGEEFLAVVTKEPKTDIYSLFTELNNIVEQLQITHSCLPRGYVTVSIGVAKIEVYDESVKFERVIEKADEALYQVKGSGKGKTIEYTDTMIEE